MYISQAQLGFRKPDLFERMLNKGFRGLGLGHNYLLEVQGRKIYRVYSTPVDLLEFMGTRFLVAPRGRTPWVHNAEGPNQIALKRRPAPKIQIRIVSDDEKSQILKEYLDRFNLTVQRYFLIEAGSKSRYFVTIVSLYPVFELFEL